MLTSIRGLAAASLVLSATLAATPALADETDPPGACAGARPPQRRGAAFDVSGHGSQRELEHAGGIERPAPVAPVECWDQKI